MCSNNDKPLPVMNDFVVEHRIEEDPEESNFELYLMKKSKLKNKKLEYRKQQADRLTKEKEGYAQDSVSKPVMEEKATAQKSQMKQMQPAPHGETGAAPPPAPQNFIDVPDYGFIGIDGSYQPPF